MVETSKRLCGDAGNLSTGTGPHNGAEIRQRVNTDKRAIVLPILVMLGAPDLMSDVSGEKICQGKAEAGDDIASIEHFVSAQNAPQPVRPIDDRDLPCRIERYDQTSARV